MASATQKTLTSARARDPQEFEDTMGDIERSTAAVQRQYGAGQQMGVDPRFARAAPAQEYQAGELQRRQAAIDPAFQTATTIGEREAGVQNALAQSLQKYQSDIADLGQKAAQSEAATNFESETALRALDEKQRELGWGLYKSRAERNDAIQSAYRQGIAEERLLDTTISKEIKLQDIDMYWTALMNDMENRFSQWQTMTKADFDAWQTDLETKSAAWASIVSGIFGGIGASI